MSSATIALNPQLNQEVLKLPPKEELLKKINTERDNIIDELKNKMTETKFQLLKNALLEQKIFIPENVKTVEKLLKYVKKNLSKEQYASVLKQKQSLDKSIEGMLDELTKGSTTAFTYNMKKILKTVKDVGLIIAKPLALNALLTMLTPPPLQIFTGIGLIAHSGYKLVKSFKGGKIANKQYALSKMIRETEITKDDKNQITDTRFSPSIQEKIREFLKENKIEFQDTGYVSLMNVIYSLDIEKKQKICNLINNNLGNPFDINKELKKYNSSIFERLSTGFAPAMQMAGVGIDIADTINDVAFFRNLVSSGIIGGTTYAITQDAAIATGAALGNTTVGTVSSITGFGNDIVKGIQSVINKGGFALLFGLIGITGSASLALINYLKGKKARIENSIQNKKIIELDQQLYADEIKKEQDLIRKKMLENPDLAQVMIVSLVCEYMNKKGIEIPKNINTVNELVSYINSLDKEKHQDIIKFYEDLMYYNKHNHSAFMKKVNETISTITNIATVGLAGMSLYDLFVDKYFLEEIGNKITEPLYHNVSSATTSVIETVKENSEIKFPASNGELRVNVVEPAKYYTATIDEAADVSNFDANNVAGYINNLSAEDIYIQLTRACIYDNNVTPNESGFEILFNSLTRNKVSEVVDYCNALNNGTTTLNGYSGAYHHWNDTVVTRLNEQLIINYPTPSDAIANIVNGFNPETQINPSDVGNYLSESAVDLNLAVPPAQIITGIQTVTQNHHNQKYNNEFQRPKDRDETLRYLNNIQVNQEDNSESHERKTR